MFAHDRHIVSKSLVWPTMADLPGHNVSLPSSVKVDYPAPRPQDEEHLKELVRFYYLHSNSTEDGVIQYSDLKCYSQILCGGC